MNKFLKYIKKNILISTIIGIIIFVLINLTLNLLHLKFVYMVYLIMFVISFIGVVIGIFQILLKLKKIAKIIMILLFSIILLIIVPFTLILLIVWYKPTHIVEINGEKLLAEVECAFFVRVNYYNYKIPFIINKTPRMKESYGKGSYDPIAENRQYLCCGTCYYDRKGNIVSDFYGTPYIDLSNIAEYKSNNSTSEKTIEFLEKLMKNYKKNISELELYGDNGFIIHFSEKSEEIVDDNELKRIEFVISQYIEEIRLIESICNDSKYKIIVADFGEVIVNPVDNTQRKVSNKIAMDITEDFIKNPKVFNGKVYYKEIDSIHFKTEDNKYYILKNDSRISFIDSQTNENYKFENIKIEQHISTTINCNVLIY